MGIKKIKIFFSLLLLSILVLILGGRFLLGDNYYLSKKFVASNVEYVKNKLAFTESVETPSNLALLANLFQNTKPVESAGKNYGSTNDVPILLYHGIVGKADELNISADDFKTQMFALKRAGWQTVSMQDFYQFMQGKKQLPEKSFLITFDDGRKDSYYGSDPIFRALGYQAVIFDITGYSFGKGKSSHYLSADELEAMVKSKRWEIQSHGQNDHDLIEISANGEKGHFLSNKMWLKDKNRLETEAEFIQRISQDLILAKNDLEQGLEKPVVSFAFPFGDYGQNKSNLLGGEEIILAQTKKVYPLAFYQTWQWSGFLSNYFQNGKEHFLFKRIEVKPDWTADDLLAILEQSQAKPLPLQDNFAVNIGWTRTWGSLALKNNVLKISANASTTGASTFLDGSYLWQDYAFEAKIPDFSNATSGVFSLTSRYQNLDNYLSCGFNINKIVLKERIAGKEKTIAEWKTQYSVVKQGEDVDLGMQVVGQRARCLVNGSVVLTTNRISPDLANGGVGFSVWDKEPGRANLVVKEVFVEELGGNGIMEE